MSNPDRPTAELPSSATDPGPGTVTASVPAEIPDGTIAASMRPALRAPLNLECADAPKRGGRDRAQQQPHLGSDLQAVIGRQLRAAYHEVLNEPVPDRFVQLLKDLATKPAGQA